MKSLILVFTILLSFAGNAATVDVLSNHDSIQEGKIEAAYLAMLEEDIKKTEAALEFSVANLNEPITDHEGKILAAMINMIEDEIVKAKKMHDALSNENVIDDSSAKDLRKQIKDIFDLIAGLSS